MVSSSTVLDAPFLTALTVPAVDFFRHLSRLQIVLVRMAYSSWRSATSISIAPADKERSTLVPELLSSMTRKEFVPMLTWSHAAKANALKKSVTNSNAPFCLVTNCIGPQSTAGPFSLAPSLLIGLTWVAALSRPSSTR